MPTGDSALEVVKVHYSNYWDETLKRTSKFVKPRCTDEVDDAAGDKTPYMLHLILSRQQHAAERHRPPH